MRGWDLELYPQRGLNSQARVNIIDNSGAKIAKIHSFFRIQGVKRRYPRGGIGWFARASVIEGNSSVVGTKVVVYITNQVAPFKVNGQVWNGERNEGVLVDLEGPKGVTLLGTKIVSPIYSFLRSRVPRILSIAKRVIYL